MKIINPRTGGTRCADADRARRATRTHSLITRLAAGGLALAAAGAAVVWTAAPASAVVTVSVQGTTLVINLGAANDTVTITPGMALSGYEAMVAGTGFAPMSFSGFTSVAVSSSTDIVPQGSISDPNNFVLSYGSQSVTFTDPYGYGFPSLVPQQLAFSFPGGTPTGPSVTYGQPDFSPASVGPAYPGVTETYSPPVTYTGASGSCSVVGGGTELHITGTGTCTVTASSPAMGGVGAAPPVTVTFAINPAALSVNAQDASVVYGQAPSLGYTLSGFVNGENAASAVVTGAADCTASPGSADPGTYPGAITCTPGTLAAANYTFTTGSSATETITPAPQSITFTSTPPSPAMTGGAYPVAATGGASGQPVMFNIDGASDPGACTITGAQVSFTGAGSCVIDANQAGTTDYAPAPQAQQKVTVIGKQPTTTTLTTSAGPSLFAQPVTFTATVTSPGGTPAGQVTFSDGGTPLGTAPLADGMATLTTATLALGSHAITATYPGGPGFAGSASGPLTQVVRETPDGLCRLTAGYVEASPKYQALPPAQQTMINRMITGLCDQLATIVPQLTPHQLVRLIAAYKLAVTSLAGADWLTAAQASTLAFLADHLTIT